MSAVYIIDILSLICYCVTIGGILYHRHWLKVNRGALPTFHCAARPCFSINQGTGREFASHKKL